MAIFTKNKDLDRIQLYLEKEIADLRQEISKAGINLGSFALAQGAGGGGGIRDLRLLGSEIIITDTRGQDYRLDLTPILEKITSFTLTGQALTIATNIRSFLVTLPLRDVIQGFSLTGRTLNLETDEENYAVDLSGVTGKITDFSISGRTISLTYDSTTRTVQVPDSELISSFSITAGVATLTTNRGEYRATLPEITADTIKNVRLIGDTILSIETDQKTHNLQLPSGGDTIQNLSVNASNNLILETVRGNFVTAIPRQGDLIEGLRVVDGTLFLDIVGKESFSVKLPVGTVTPGPGDPDPGDGKTPNVPTGEDTRSFFNALHTESSGIILIEDGQDFFVTEDITGHVAGLPAGRDDAIITEGGEVLITEAVVDVITIGG